MLKGVFFSTVLAAVAVVAFDIYAYAGRGGFEGWPGLPASSPTTIAPPTPDDQTRRYAPNATPRLSQDSAPQLPGVADPEAIDASAPMTFLRGPGGAASAVGKISIGAAGALERFLDAQDGEIRALHLHSPGGSVQDALAMADMLRTREVTTIVSDGSYCASSCPLVLAGGKDRRVGAKALVGLHQVYAERGSLGQLSDGIAQAQSITAAIQERLAGFDIDPAVWIHAMRTPSREIYFLTQKELTNSRLSLGKPE